MPPPSPQGGREEARVAPNPCLVYPRLITLFQTPIGNFDALGEPHAGKTLGVANKFLDDLGAERHAGNKRVAVEGEKLRRSLLPFPVEIVELVLHDLEQVPRRAPRAPG